MLIRQETCTVSVSQCLWTTGCALAATQKKCCSRVCVCVLVICVCCPSSFFPPFLNFVTRGGNQNTPTKTWRSVFNFTLCSPVVCLPPSLCCEICERVMDREEPTLNAGCTPHTTTPLAPAAVLYCSLKAHFPTIDIETLESRRYCVVRHSNSTSSSKEREKAKN